MVLVRSSNNFEKKIKIKNINMIGGSEILFQESSQSKNVSSEPTFLCANDLLAKSDRWPMD